MSGTAVLPTPSSGRALSKSTVALLALASVAAVTFIALAALPYFALNEQRFGPFWTKRGWLLLHITGGMAALLAGPVQFWLGLTDQRMQIHRKIGTTYVICVAASAAAAYYLAITTQEGWVFAGGLVGLATTWLLTTGLAYLSARKYLFDQHREWMIRSYVVTFAFVTFRVLAPLLQSMGVGTEQEQIGFAAWSSWAIPLVMTEAVLQGKKIFAVPSA
jgi:uncharacterized membrane protein